MYLDLKATKILPLSSRRPQATKQRTFSLTEINFKRVSNCGQINLCHPKGDHIKRGKNKVSVSFGKKFSVGTRNDKCCERFFLIYRRQRVQVGESLLEPVRATIWVNKNYCDSSVERDRKYGKSLCSFDRLFKRK